MTLVGVMPDDGRVTLYRGDPEWDRARLLRSDRIVTWLLIAVMSLGAATVASDPRSQASSSPR